MRTALKSVLFALLLLAAPALSAGAASASSSPAPATAAGTVLHAAVGVQAGTGAVVPAGTWPTPSPGDTASTGPANPGTGESAQSESTRLDWAPWFIAGIAVLVLIAILIWRRRRNTTIVG